MAMKAASGALVGAAALALSVAAIAHAQQAGPAGGQTQGGPGGAPPPRPATPVQDNELLQTWNERVSGGSPMGGLEVDGWSLAASMPRPAPNMRWRS